MLPVFQIEVKNVLLSSLSLHLRSFFLNVFLNIEGIEKFSSSIKTVMIKSLKNPECSTLNKEKVLLYVSVICKQFVQVDKKLALLSCSFPFL